MIMSTTSTGDIPPIYDDAVSPSRPVGTRHAERKRRSSPLFDDIIIEPSNTKTTAGGEEQQQQDAAAETVVGVKQSTRSMSSVFVERRTLDIVYDFLVTTTAHGWGHVARGFNAPIKSVWLVLTLSAFGINVAHVMVLVLQYLRYPYEQVTEVDVGFVEFPSITICNLQPISRSTAAAMDADKTTRFHQWNAQSSEYFEYLLANNVTPVSYEYEMMYDRMRGPRGFFENIGLHEASIVGHQARDMIVHCSFSKQLCGPDNFTWFASADFYNCYTFNGIGGGAFGNVTTIEFGGGGDDLADGEALDGPLPLVASSTGPESGLALTLYVESDVSGLPMEEYDGPYYAFQNTGNAAGIRVTVHQPRTRPNAIDSGFDVPPGYSSSVGLSVTRYTRLGQPYGDCADERQQGEHKDRFAYSTNGCLMKCQQRYVVSQCSCVSATLPPLDAADIRSAMSTFSSLNSADGWAASSLAYAHFCGQFNPIRPAGQLFIDTQCEADTMRRFSMAESIRNKCGCNAPCVETAYRRDASYSYWPADYTQGTFYRKYVLDNPDRDSMKVYRNLGQYNVSELVRRGLIRNNFVRLNVYVESLLVDEVVQKPNYSFFNLISNIGGTFGLWIGMSVLTWGEVVEFVVHLGFRWVAKLRRHRQALSDKATAVVAAVRASGKARDESNKNHDV